MITIQITSASKVGCVRSQNEDMILVGNHFVRNDGFATRVDLTNSDRYIVAVADGMGGHNRGDVASSDALHNLQFFFHDLPTGLNPNGINEMLIGWLDSINNVIASKGRSDEQYKGMGTTLVGIAFYEGEFYSMNCGDSRLYRFRNGELTQLTPQWRAHPAYVRSFAQQYAWLIAPFKYHYQLHRRWMLYIFHGYSQDYWRCEDWRRLLVVQRWSY